jgi:hypothetical protein
MIFRPELVDKILAGSKTVTRRRLPRSDKPRKRYREGQTYAVQPGRGKHHVGHIRVSGVRIKPLHHVKSDFRAEGFGSLDEFADYWKHLHGSIDWNESVAVIWFELAPRCDDCHFW